MALTNRSRLSCLKRRQKREQRKLVNQAFDLNSVTGVEAALQPLLNVSTKERAWNKYLHAKAIYEETKNFEHWQYAQQCLTDYEKAAS